MTSMCLSEPATMENRNLQAPRVLAVPSSSTPLGASDGASRAMDRYSVGDEAAFAEVYDFVAPRLFASLSRRTRDRARAEDLLQRTFLHMHRARGTFIRGSDVLRWAYAISRRLGIDDHRRCVRDPVDRAEPESDWACPRDGLVEGELAARETAARLQAALDKLPEKQREAFELIRLDGLSHEDAAAVLATTVSAVKLRAHRAYEVLRTVLEDG